MTRIAPAVFATLALFPLSARPLGAQWLNTHEADESCKAFVQSFYDFYSPMFSNQQRDGSPIEPWTNDSKVLQVLDPELARQLRELFDAQAKSGIVLLDFDPVLNSQHAEDEYVIGEISHKGDHFLVNVYGVSNGRQANQPDVIPELVFEVRKWVFVNFHYPSHTHSSSDENLVSMLKKIRKSVRENSANPQGENK